MHKSKLNSYLKNALNKPQEIFIFNNKFIYIQLRHTKNGKIKYKLHLVIIKRLF
jgi:hypothetical protein